MELKKAFDEFLQNIRLTQSHKDDLIKGHSTLRQRLEGFDEFPDGIKILNTFLQGSYRRGTAVKPNGDKRADVDVVVVTNINEHTYSPDKALESFKPFLEKYYAGKYSLNSRSYGIELSYVDLDLVITTKPNEANEMMFKSDSFILSNFTLDSERSYEFSNSINEVYDWSPDPLLIPDRDAKKWIETNPLAQIQWTQKKNALCNTHYINVVKSLKWWQINNNQNGELPKYPKGYPLEHIIGYCCPDNINSVAEGINETFKNIIDKFQDDVRWGRVPQLWDHGVDNHNVLKRITFNDFKQFYEKVENDYDCYSNVALFSPDPQESAAYWNELLGKEFPSEADIYKFIDEEGPFKNISVVGNTQPEEYA